MRARIPPSLRRCRRLSAASAAATARATLAVDSRCTLGEGIVWDDRRQALFWTDILSQALWAHLPRSGATRRWRLPDRLGCLALCDDGRLLLALAKGLHLTMPDATGELILQPLAGIEPELGSDTRSNDGRCDRAGNFVFGTKSERADGAPVGGFHQFSARHGLRRLSLPSAAIPNSICFSPDGGTLYYCDSIHPRIYRCDYDADEARVSNLRVFTEITDGGTPDGSTVDAEGFVWNARWDRACVSRHAPDGNHDRDIPILAGRPSCCAIGGAAFDTLYVTTARIDLDDDALAATPEAGGVHAFPLHGIAGLPEPRFATTGLPSP